MDIDNYNVVSPLLTGRMVDLRPKAIEGCIAEQVCSRVRVGTGSGLAGDTQAFSGTIWQRNKTGFMGGPEGEALALGAPLTPAKVGDPSTLTYTCSKYGHRSQPGIPYEFDQRSQFPTPLVMEHLDAHKIRLKLAREKRFATLVQTTGNWTGTVACNAAPGGGSVKFSDVVASKPVSLFNRLKEAFFVQTDGIEADTLVVPRSTMVYLAENYELRQLVYASAAGIVYSPNPVDQAVGDAAAKLSKAIGLRVLVGSARHNTANPGQTHSGAYIYADTVWMGYAGNNAVSAFRDQQSGQATITGDIGACLLVEEISNIPNGRILADADAGGMLLAAGVDQEKVSLGGVIVPWALHYEAMTKTSATLGYTVTDCE